METLEDVLAKLERGELLPIPGHLAADLAAAAAAGRPEDVDAWAESLASDLAEAGESEG